MRKIVIAQGLALILFGLYLAIGMSRATTPERDGHRYWLVYTGLEPGQFDLRDALRRADGLPASEAPAIPVEIRALRPPGEIRMNTVADAPAARVGGYRTWLLVAVLKLEGAARLWREDTQRAWGR